MEQLEGQIASAKIAMARLSSPQLYYVLSGNDFTLDINNPEEPKIVCMGNLAQIDTPYLTEGSSGLTFAVDKFKGWPHGGHITLARGERSRLADFASEVL